MGGVRFELLVAVYYLIKLLRQEVPRGTSFGTIHEVRLQQRNRNCPVDDIILDCRSTLGKTKLYLQVKHNIAFSSNEQFVEVIQQAWRQLSNPEFRQNIDSLGLAIGEVCNNNTVRNHVQDVLKWSQTSINAKSFYTKVEKFSVKTKIVKSFADGLQKTIGRKPQNDEVYRLLKHFVVIPFDFEKRTGRDHVDIRDQLIKSVEHNDERNAGSLFSILYDMASEYASQAGEISRDSLSKRISVNASFSVPILIRSGMTTSNILTVRLKNRIASEKNSKKYIPEVFVEVGDVKERARLFCHPVLFLKKLERDIAQIDLFSINRHLNMSGLEPFTINISSKTLSGTFESLEQDAQYLRNELNKLSSSLDDLKRENQSIIFTRIPPDRQYVFEEISWVIGDIASHTIDYKIEPLLKNIDIVVSRVMAIVSRAGQGKTNFVCDFAENCLAPRGIPCAYFTGKELSSVGRKQLSDFISKSIYGELSSNKIYDCLNDINEEACKKGTAGIIIIDAINEHPDVHVFSQEIEELIEKCLTYPRIRVLLTCRSEYFDLRFSNLLASSFAHQFVVEREIQQRMSNQHKKRLLDGYFGFFKIRISSMSKHVTRQFEEDPFLLRIFCEVYGDHNAQSERSLKPLYNIRRGSLFQGYFNKKLTNLNTRTVIKTGFLLGNSHPYQDLLRTIIRWMLDNDLYENVPISIFHRDKLGNLSDLLDEDILVRRDLISESILGGTEVINFTFDECRDFLLSDYLLNVLINEDAIRFADVVEKLTQPQKTIAEGLQEYLFYASRHLGNSEASEIIKKQQWYEEIYLYYVFYLDESDITVEDSMSIKNACLKNHYMAPQIACELMSRYDTNRYTHANITSLFEVLDELSDSEFDNLCKKAFGMKLNAIDHVLYPIDKLANDIEHLFSSTAWRSSYEEICKLFLYLWNLHDINDTFPARDFYKSFSKVHPVIASRLKEMHANLRRKGYMFDLSNDYSLRNDD